jgi:hypothetical protein
MIQGPPHQIVTMEPGVAEDMSVIFDELMRLIAREYIIKNMVSKF